MFSDVSGISPTHLAWRFAQLSPRAKLMPRQHSGAFVERSCRQSIDTDASRVGAESQASVMKQYFV